MSYDLKAALLKVSLTTGTCRAVRLYLPDDPRTPEEREDDPDAQLLDTVIDGCGGAENAMKVVHFSSGYKPHERAARQLRRVCIEILRDQRGDPRLSLTNIVRDNVESALHWLDEWLNTSAVDRLSALA